MSAATVVVFVLGAVTMFIMLAIRDIPDRDEPPPCMGPPDRVESATRAEAEDALGFIGPGVMRLWNSAIARESVTDLTLQHQSVQEQLEIVEAYLRCQRDAEEHPSEVGQKPGEGPGPGELTLKLPATPSRGGAQ